MPGKNHNSKRRSITSRRKSKQRYRTEVSAGGFVFKRTKRGLYVAMLSDSFGRWTFPKGHVKKGETRAKAAAREIREEMGLSGLKFIKPLGQIDIWFKDRFVHKGTMVHKYIHYFLFEAPEHARVRIPKGDADGGGETIHDVAWIPINQVLKKSSYQDLKPVIRRALVILKQSTRSSRGGKTPSKKSQRPHASSKKRNV